MLDRVAVLPGDRRPASAFRRFPPGCGRHHNASAGPPPYHWFPTAAAATKTKPSLPNPSSARAATNAAPPPATRTLPAAVSFGAEAPDSGEGNGGKAAAAVTVHRVSAVRRYPPGCGRGAPVPKSKPPVSEGDDGATRDRDGDSMMLRASALDQAEIISNVAMKNGGDGVAGAQEEGGGMPWVVTGLMAVPLLPWAQHGKRAQRLND